MGGVGGIYSGCVFSRRNEGPRQTGVRVGVREWRGDEGSCRVSRDQIPRV